MKLFNNEATEACNFKHQFKKTRAKNSLINNSSHRKKNTVFNDADDVYRVFRDGHIFRTAGVSVQVLVFSKRPNRHR